MDAPRSGWITGSTPRDSGPVDILEGLGTLTGECSTSEPQPPTPPLFIWDGPGFHSIDGSSELTAIPFDGAKGVCLQPIFAGSDVITCNSPIGRIDFDEPAPKFGGYWLDAVTTSQAGPISLSFFDVANSPIDEIAFHYDFANLRGESEWFAWQSTVPIHAVSFTGFWASVDGLQVTLVPEPSSVFVAGICGLVAATRLRFAGFLRRPSYECCVLRRL